MKDDFAFAFQFLDVLVQAKFADGTKGMGRHFQRDPLARFGHEEFFGVQVREKTPLGFAVRVRHIIACNWPFARQITNFRHDFLN